MKKLISIIFCLLSLIIKIKGQEKPIYDDSNNLIGSYYENGQIHSIYKKINIGNTPYIQGTMYNIKGQLLSVENWKGQTFDIKNWQANNQKDGAWEEYYENGQLKSKMNYKLNVLDGERVEYYENGNVENKFSYLKGREVEFISYFRNGNLQAKRTYLKDKLYGDEIVYYENGNVHTKENYVYYENGNILTKEKYYLNRKLDGERTKFTIDGIIQIKEHYKNGALNGEQARYDEKGEVMNIRQYSNGVYTGGTYYYANGKISGTRKIVNGKDEAVGYYETGEIQSRGAFTNEDDNIYFGDQIGYYKNGSVEYKVINITGAACNNPLWNYENGKIVFPYGIGNSKVKVLYYDEKGVLKK